MPTTFTCGGPTRRTEFAYDGDFDSGVIIKFGSGNTKVSHNFLKASIDHFRGKEVVSQ